MSGGLHRLWKDTFAAKVNARNHPGFRHLDVAGGTGDIAFRVAKQAPADAEIVVLDINGDMLEVGRDRARERGLDAQARIRAGQRRVPALPRRQFRRLHDRLRHPQRAAHPGRAGGGVSRAKARRALPVPRIFAGGTSPGSTRFTRPIPSTSSRWSARSSRATASPIAISSNPSSKFPRADEFERMIRKAGFRRTGYERLTGGVVAIHSGWKP